MRISPTGMPTDAGQPCPEGKRDLLGIKFHMVLIQGPEGIFKIVFIKIGQGGPFDLINDLSSVVHHF